MNTLALVTLLGMMILLVGSCCLRDYCRRQDKKMQQQDHEVYE